MFFIKQHKIIAAIVSVVIIGLLSMLYIFYDQENDAIEPIVINEIEETTTSIRSIRVDIKGAVNKPGVYEVNANSIVNDVIILAGGLAKNATTSNINLSQRVADEMVIYIFTKSELTTTVINKITEVKCTTQVIEVNNCITKPTEITTTTKAKYKININNATKEELLTISGIGESKADAIIEYRKETPFNKIEDIMNITGIGESVFAKIKDYITI